jgi:MFS family permease
MDANAVSHGIQLAVAPVFMLTAVASLIGALATRLSRIIDRARDLEERLDAGTINNHDAAYSELGRLKLRGSVVNWSVALLTLSATLIGATVMALFLGETTLPHSEQLVPWSFLGGVICFVLALLCFLVETLLASHVLDFKHRPDK